MLARLKAKWIALRGMGLREKPHFKMPRRGRPWWKIRPLPSFLELSLAFTVILALITANWLGLFSRMRADMAQPTTEFDSFGNATAITGDTLNFRGVPMHLAGILSPTRDVVCHAKRDRRRTNCGTVAADTLGALVSGREIRCTGASHDRHGRPAATCSVVIAGQRTELALYMVQNGWACADRLDSQRYAMDEIGARIRQNGLWATDYIPPGTAPAGEVASR